MPWFRLGIFRHVKQVVKQEHFKSGKRINANNVVKADFGKVAIAA